MADNDPSVVSPRGAVLPMLATYHPTPALRVKSFARYAMQCDGSFRYSRHFNTRFRAWLPWPFGDVAPRFQCDGMC